MSLDNFTPNNPNARRDFKGPISNTFKLQSNAPTPPSTHQQQTVPQPAPVQESKNQFSLENVFKAFWTYALPPIVAISGVWLSFHDLKRDYERDKVDTEKAKSEEILWRSGLENTVNKHISEDKAWKDQWQETLIILKHENERKK